MNKLLQHPVIDCIICTILGLSFGGCIAKHHYEQPDGPATPTPALTLKVSANPRVGHFIDVTGVTSSNQVAFKVTGPIEPDIREVGDKGLTLVTSAQGDYTIQGHAYLPHWYWPWNGSIVEASRLVQVRSDTPNPTPPGPNPPGPTPPGPGPAPVPTDPFLTTLQSAWSQEADKGKVEQLQKLTEAFKVAGSKTVNDPALTNMGQLWQTVHDDFDEAAGQGNLMKLRSAIGVEMKSVLSKDTATSLDAATRKKAADFFNRMAVDLGALK